MRLFMAVCVLSAVWACVFVAMLVSMADMMSNICRGRSILVGVYWFSLSNMAIIRSNSLSFLNFMLIFPAPLLLHVSCTGV